MSIIKSISEIKNIISGEDSFLRGGMFLEKLYMKNRVLLFSVLILGSLSFFVYIGINYYNSFALEKANKAYNKLMKNSKDSSAIKELESNKNLYETYQFMKALESKKFDKLNLNSVVLSDILKFQSVISSKNPDKILEYANSTSVLRDYALLQASMLYIDNKKYASARRTLKKITNDSRIKKNAESLEHFLITKVK